MILSKKRITKALISLRGCAGWSAPVLFANPQRQVFSRRGPNHIDSQNSSPLRAACINGNIAMVKFFLEHGADITVVHSNKCTCLMEACRFRQYDIVKYLIEKGADLEVEGEYGRTALHIAVAEPCNLAIVKLLAECGAASKKDDHNATPLMYAAAICNVVVVEYLSNKPGCSRQEKIEALELLGASYMDLHCWDMSQAYAYLKTAMEERYKYSVNKIIERPISAYENRRECQTLDDLEIIENYKKAFHMETLIIRDRLLGCSPLMISALGYKCVWFHNEGMHYTCIDLKLRALKLSQRINAPFPIIQFLCEFAEILYKGELVNFERLLEVLSESCLEVEFSMQRISKERVKSGDDAYCYLLQNIRTFVYLIIGSLQVSRTNEDKNKVCEVVRRFLQLQPVMQNGYTILHLCCDRKMLQKQFRYPVLNAFPITVLLYRTLLCCGLSVNAQDKNKNTPLHILASEANKVAPRDMKTHIDILTCLLENGAHIDACNNLGETAIDVATEDTIKDMINKHKKIDLKCIASKVIKKYDIPIKNIIPKCMVEYVALH